MKQIAISTLVLAIVPALLSQTNVPPQTTSNPVVSTVRQLEERQSKNLIGAAEEMPADKYSYHPTPEQMSFAHLVMHVAESNNGLCARIAGEQPPAIKLSETDSKETLANALKDSFAYCDQVLAKAEDSTLGQPVTFSGGRTGTRAGALINLVAGWADHYGAAAIYLRLNNLLPPSAQKTPAK
jgi:uncharacterized damage-inducible protein DinB